jgi:DNA-directed RNA polymerase specialized sigma24 family protein
MSNVDTDWLRSVYYHATHEVRRREGIKSSRFDDLVQEGAIRAWQVRERKADDMYAWVAARRRMRAVGRGVERELGDKFTSSHTLSEHNARGRRTSYEALSEAGYDVPSKVDAPASSDMIALLRKVLDVRQREIVYRRFWLDESYPEIAEAMGAEDWQLRKEWSLIIRPLLRAQLAHLQKVC